MKDTEAKKEEIKEFKESKAKTGTKTKSKAGAVARNKKIGARESIASQMKERRKDLGMTQEHLAELVGTKKSNISRFESGRYNPSLDFLIKLAEGLDQEIELKLR